ncbi:MAG: HK97 gp10 family phage protein [Corynebacterium nuruki]|nr:HK97 gp10 family phage protein [Corynebacterium nuruki]
MPATARLTIFDQQARQEARQHSQKGLLKIANEAAGQARAAAPVLTGAYRGGISVAHSGNRVSIIDTDPTAIHKEYGTSDTPPHAALTDAAMRAGEYRGMMPRGMTRRSRRRRR